MPITMAWLLGLRHVGNQAINILYKTIGIYVKEENRVYISARAYIGKLIALIAIALKTPVKSRKVAAISNGR